MTNRFLFHERCSMQLNPGARQKWIWVMAFVLAVSVAPAFVRAQNEKGITITLKNKFIDEYKNRATISANYTVDKAHKHPNPPAKDGDMHIAGRSPEIELATVAEIMNAKFQQEAVDRVHEVEGTGQAIPLVGAWRIWCEHGGTKPQIQGDQLNAFNTTNPPHVFEIHPLTSVDGKQLHHSLVPITGFRTKDAHDAFVKYENITCEIIPNGATTTLITHMAGYNYVEFILQLNEDPKALADGHAVLCQVRDLEGELLVHNRRMVTAKGTEPDAQIARAKKNQRLHVVGVPRVDLALVAWRVQHADDPRKPLTWNLPYEIIVAGVYPDSTEED
jgi:hypothetical protein